MYFDTFEHVFRLWRLVFQLLWRSPPSKNSAAGSVERSVRSHAQPQFFHSASARLEGKPPSAGSSRRRAFRHQAGIPHPQAINQCSAFLAGLKDVKVTAAENTAAAAKLVANPPPRRCALCSRYCGENYGLKILRPGVQDKGTANPRASSAYPARPKYIREPTGCP